MMIGIDASRANKPGKTGVEWYAYHVIQELKKITVNDGNQWVLYTREPLSGGLEDLPENWYEVRAGWWPKYLWTQVRMSWEMWRRPCDVLFVPAHIFPPIRPERGIVTVHDVGFRRLPDLYKAHAKIYHEFSTKRIAKSDARILTVSKFCGHEISELYGIDPSRIAITYLGIDHTLYHPISDGSLIESVLRKHHISGPFFFYIGRIEMKKNVLNLVKAFNSFKSHRGLGDPTMLVLAGPLGYGSKEVEVEIAKSPYREQIRLAGYISEEDVPVLISAAKGYVHLAWYEGFCIPVIQAMACGCPVIASNSSCIPEIAGEGNAILVAPEDIEDASRAMERLMEDSGLVQELKTRGIAHAKDFSWEATAKATLPVLKEWLGKR